MYQQNNNTVMHSVHHPGGTLMKYHRMKNKTSPSYSCTEKLPKADWPSGAFFILDSWPIVRKHGKKVDSLVVAKLYYGRKRK